MPFRRARQRRPSLRVKIIASLLGAVLICLLLCLTALLLLIDNILGGFIQSDVDFAMREISGNLRSKTVYLEDILLALRDDDLLAGALSGPGLEPGPESATQAELRRVVNIYSNKNTDLLDGPFLEMVYLFDRDGGFNSSTYVDYLAETQRELDGRLSALNRAFIASGQDVSVSMQGERLHIFYIVYDARMDPIGSALFAVSQEAVRQLMAKADQYRDAFWFLSDKRGGVTLASDGFSLDAQEAAHLALDDRYAPYDIRLGAGRYRVYSERMSMGVGATVGVPSGQLSRLLYSTVKYYLVIPAALLMAVGALLFWRVLRLTRPLSEVAASLQKVAEARFDVRLPAYGSSEFDTISDTFNSMIRTINHLINDVYEKKLLAIESELHFLQAQMNPHFLYNVLNTIALKAKLEGNDEIARMASNFSGLTQALLYHQGNDIITLEQELKLVRFYLELQKSRFEDKLSYNISVEDERLLQCRLPKLIVEIIVENAVTHGIEPKEGPGSVNVDIARDGGDLVIRIEDDGVGFEGRDGATPLAALRADRPKEGHNHVALENAQKIIRLFYGEAYGVAIKSRQGAGALVCIRVPADEGGAKDVPGDGGGRRADDAQSAQGTD